MEIDSPSSGDAVSPRARIMERLATIGVPEEYLEDLPLGLVSFIKNCDACIPTLVSAILPTDAEAAEAIHDAKAGSKRALGSPAVRDLFRVSMTWLQWLMFKEEPFHALDNLERMNVGQGGICGAVWGKDEVAFRCRTCEHDPTCVICVSCFQNGNHKDHDYSIIYTGGGCCDCGDESAWKPEGFCSRHKGAEMIQPLRDDIAQSVGPVLDALFDCWGNKLVNAKYLPHEKSGATDHATELRKIWNEFTSAVVEMLLEFCRRSESLLSFISKRVIAAAGLLDALVRAEKFLSELVIKRLHELLLKLLGEPVFKYEFGKATVSYYPVFVQEAVKARKDNILKRYSLLPFFSVQILTVPTLTMRLMEEVNVLKVLLDCVVDILFCCSGGDGLLQMDKFSNLFDTIMRLLGDVKFVLSHPEVAEYLRNEQQNIQSAWLRILSFVQGMNPQKRETGIHIEEENDSVHLPFYLCSYLFDISSLLAACTFSLTDGRAPPVSWKINVEDEHGQRLAKVGSMSEESFASTSAGAKEWTTLSSDFVTKPDGDKHVMVPAYVLLACECLKVIDHWLVTRNTLNVVPSGDSGDFNCKFLSFKSALLKVRKGKYFGLCDEHESDDLQSVQCGEQISHPDLCKMDIDSSHDLTDGDDIMEEDFAVRSDCFQVLSSPDWQDINYDVSSLPISMHIPYHRLLSFILKEALSKYCGESVMLNPGATTCEGPLKSSTVLLEKILRGCQPYGFSSFIMEHPLQIRVLCAQVRAGMWRRNGQAGVVSCDLYRSDHRHTNPLELDLFLMQICAAFAPPDLYFKRILDRFGLLDYLSLNLQHSSEFEPVLAQEMLALIIQIIKERRHCGFTASESMQRELVRKLATGDATHSQLQKSLPRDLGKLDLQDVLDSVAQYSNPTGMKQGRYTLRPSCWKDLDLYHPRWTPRDLQVAEERYLRVCGVSAMTSQLPKWNGIYQPLIGVSRIATCKMVLEVIRAVLFYAVNDRTPQSRAPDGVLVAALHLLSLGLDICILQKEFGQLHQDGDVIPLLAFAAEEFKVGPANAPDKHSLLSLLASLFRIDKNEKLSLVEVGKFNLSPLVESLLMKLGKLDTDCKRKLSELAPDVFNHLFRSSIDNGANRLDSASDAENHKAKARQRQAAIMEKMRAAQSKFLENVKAEAENGADDLKAAKGEQEEASIESNEICCLCHDSSPKTPVSFLVLLQKSRLLSFVNRGPPTWDQDLQSDKDNVYATANTMTISSESGLVESSKHAVPLSELKQLVQDALNEFAHGGFPVEVENLANYLREQIPGVRITSVPPISGGPKERIANSLESLEEDLFHSIKKQMNVAACDSVAMNDGSIVPPEEGLLDNVDIDTVLLGKYLASLTREPVNVPYDSDDTGQRNDLAPHDGFGPTNCDGVHLSSCGHAVHQICLDRYLSSLIDRHNRRMIFEGRHIVNLDQGEFLCPVCHRLVNSVLPVYPRDPRSLWDQPVGTDRSSVNKEAKSSFHHGLCLLKSAASVISSGEVLEAATMSSSSREASPSVAPFSKKLCGMYFPTYGDTFSRAGRVSPSLIMWDTLKYSLISTEIAARSIVETNSTSDCCALDSELNSSGGFASSLMLRLVQHTRGKSLFDVLLRLRSLVLFTASVCYGSGLEGSSASSSMQEGKIVRILKHTDGDLLFPDIQFWNRASDPVLSRDPFSTLMWILFCLPHPFMSHMESLYSLVHIFHAVTVTQGIIACCVRDGGKMAELCSSDCLVTDIVYSVAESGIAHQYFVCSDIDPSCNAVDSIRLLSLPFLRRCALICKLLKNSTSGQLFGGDCSYATAFNAAHGMDTSSCVDDLDEVSKLENMFRIPPLDTVLRDKQLRSQVPKWVHHFHEMFGCCNILSVLRLTPAVPFQLMRLPFVYQDLLQRYIKPRCPYCRDVQPEAALCLLCGRLCSASWKFCCRESAWQSHAASCGAGTGVFLLIKRNGRRCFWPSPYLDAFGEEDLELRRGKPLYLNEERYSTLNYTVASHGLDRSSKVLRNTTTGLFPMV